MVIECNQQQMTYFNLNGLLLPVIATIYSYLAI